MSAHDYELAILFVVRDNPGLSAREIYDKLPVRIKRLWTPDYLARSMMRTLRFQQYVRTEGITPVRYTLSKRGEIATS